MMGEQDKIVPHKDPKWDAAVASMPAMKCGRLDGHTYDAATGRPQRFMYIEGVEKRTLVEGPYCDEIAYAAQSYAALLARAEAAEARVKVLEEALRKGMGFHVTHTQRDRIARAALDATPPKDTHDA